MDCGPPGSSVHGILQPRILEWVAISFPVHRSSEEHGTNMGKIPLYEGQPFPRNCPDSLQWPEARTLLLCRVCGRPQGPGKAPVESWAVCVAPRCKRTFAVFFPSPLAGNILDFHLVGWRQSCLDHRSAEQALHTEGMWVTLELTIISGKVVSNGCGFLMVAHSLVVVRQRH